MRRLKVNSIKIRKIPLNARLILKVNPKKKLKKKMERKKMIKLALIQVNCKKAWMDGNSISVRKFITQ
jgi:hypothetical protein